MQLSAVAPNRWRSRWEPITREGTRRWRNSRRCRRSPLEVFDILAVDLSSSTAEVLARALDVEVIEVKTFEEVAAFERTSALGWGYPLPSDDDIRSAHRKVTPGSFLAHCAGVPAGTGGFTSWSRSRGCGVLP